MNNVNDIQISESRRLALLLAISGGLMDAYTYIFRGEVFANAQTGNILLLGVNLSKGNYQTALHYFFPVMAFALGIVFSELIRHLCTKGGILHWRQLTVLLECLILFFVGFFPETHHLPANSLVSLACGIQVESFRKVRGNAFATTMCIGNLRSGTQAFCDFIFTKEKKFLSKAFIYYSVILAFAFGAVLGNTIIPFGAEKTIWCSCILLLAGFFLMFIQKENDTID